MSASQAVWTRTPVLFPPLTICVVIKPGSTTYKKEKEKGEKNCSVDLASRNQWSQSKTTNPVTICHCRQDSAAHSTGLQLVLQSGQGLYCV